MSDTHYFPDDIYTMPAQKDQIYHSLIEAMIFNQNSYNFVLSMLTKLKNYTEENGNDIIIDILFMKYLIKSRIKHYKEEANNFNAKLIKKQKKSQYIIAYVCFNDPKSKFNFKNQIYDQSYKMLTNESIFVNGIHISKVICFYILKDLFNFFSKDLSINTDKINNNISVFKNKHYDRFSNKEKEEIKNEYKKISKKITQYYTLDFWKSVVIYQVMNNYSIEVNDNPYLFHAAACLSFQNPLIKTNFDISMLDLPNKISIGLLKLIKTRLPLDDLLDMEPYSIEIKNLSTFVYFLILNNVSFENLDQYKDSMSAESFQILQYVYRNYSNHRDSFYINDLFSSKIDIHNEDDFIKMLILRAYNKNEYNKYLINQKNKDLFYVASKNDELTCSIISDGTYSIIKKDIYKGNIEKYMNNTIIQNYGNDFNRFIQKSIKNFDGKKKIDCIKLYINNIKNNERKIEMIFELIYMKEFDDAIIFLNNLENTEEIRNIITDELHFQSIKDLLGCVNFEYACQFIKKYSIQEMISQKQKLNIIYKCSFTKKKITISRKNILNNSMNEFENNNMHHKIIKIRYELEEGIDSGGLSKDWFTNVNNEIIKSNAFIPTPNGNSLTFNNREDNLQLYNFIGKFIASAFINKKNIDMKLSLFIWKQILNEKITLEDMIDFDNELYKSLKWISENDPGQLMMTFVDSDDNELILNGKNKQLTSENKEQFINLMLDRKLIFKNSKLVDQIRLGFKEIIDFDLISIFTSKEIKEIINGKEMIDIEDWKKHTKYEKIYKQNYNDFFTIISKWSQEKLRKLLKFSTGSSIVPVQGFKYFESIGGLFYLNFIKIDSNKLPESHTCFNRIDIPCYDTIDKFENKLSLAIECDTFSIE